MTGDYRHTRVAHAFLQHGIETVASSDLRFDTIIWDLHSPRHRIIGRDDAENYGRMAYHLLVQIAKRHGVHEWEFYPDAGANIDWETVCDYIAMTSVDGPARTRPRVEHLVQVPVPNVSVELQPLDSSDERLIQLADLLAGSACFSREQDGGCADWFRGKWQEKSGQCQLDFGLANDGDANVSRGKTAKYDTVCHLYEVCKRCKLGVSLRTCGYIRTPDGDNPVNFWHWEEQHSEDIAPTRH